MNELVIGLGLAAIGIGLGCGFAYRDAIARQLTKTQKLTAKRARFSNLPGAPAIAAKSRTGKKRGFGRR